MTNNMALPEAILTPLHKVCYRPIPILSPPTMSILPISQEYNLKTSRY